MKATLYLNYNTVKKNLDSLLNDAYQLPYKHITKAESIARENVEAMGEVFQPVKDYVVNPIYKAWDLKGRAIVDKLNPLDDDFFKSRKEKKEHYD